MNALTKAFIATMPLLITACGGSGSDGKIMDNGSASLQTQQTEQQQQQESQDLTRNKEMDTSKATAIKVTLPAYTVIFRALDEATADELADAKTCPSTSANCLRWIANTISEPHVAWPRKGEDAYAKNILTASIYASQLFKQAVDESGPAKTEQALYDSVLRTIANAQLTKPNITKMVLDFSGGCNVGFIAKADNANFSMCQSTDHPETLIKRNNVNWFGVDGWIDGRKIDLSVDQSATLKISKLASYKQGSQDSNTSTSQKNMQINTN
jgi:hypothetical protein